MISKVKHGALMGHGGEVEGYWIEWVRMRPSCRRQFERGRSEALDVDSDEGELGLELKPQSTCFRLILGN